MFSIKNLLRILIVVPLVLIIFSVGFFAGATNPQILAQSQDQQPAQTVTLFRPFWETWNLVHSRYVDPIDDQKLLEGAISGMVGGLGDQHTAYMNPSTFNDLNSNIKGNFEGIGAPIERDDKTGGALILTTYAGSPAEAAGLVSGDVIVKVNGQDITGKSLDEIGTLVRGPAGTKVTISLVRKNAKQLVDLTIVRAVIKLPVVISRMIETSTGTIGYIRLVEISATATAHLQKALEHMKANSLKGLIFDLR